MKKSETSKKYETVGDIKTDVNKIVSGIHPGCEKLVDAVVDYFTERITTVNIDGNSLILILAAVCKASLDILDKLAEGNESSKP